MNLYPDIYLKNVKEITLELLRENDIQGLILDVDNTLIDFDKNPIDGLKDWCENLKENDIKFCILSNTNKVKKVVKIANLIDIPFIYFAKKPSKSGFKKAKKLLGLNERNIAVIGDQIMTDVFGGNKMNMFTILTQPIDKRDILITKIKRPLEKMIINKYLKQKNKGEKDVF